MKVLVFGATGRTGRLIVERALAAGHEVTAAIRGSKGPGGAGTVTLDLRDADRVRAEASGADAVISALASGKGNPACSTLARALLPMEGLRFVTIGGAGVDAPGDAKALPDRVIGWIMRRTVGEMLADRQAEHDMLATSKLHWTMLRPPRLTEKPGQGGYRLTYDTPAAAAIARTDLAQAAVNALDDRETRDKAPFVAGAS
ncbi:MAG: NAD(P)-dependent oxidoreductase, partial [Rhodosalinus sp.]